MTRHDFDFDPTYGYTRETLLRVVAPEPAEDFASFWRDTYAEARATSPNLAARRVESPRSDIELHEIEFDAWGGHGQGLVRLGGWFATPTDAPVKRYVVAGHGYGNPDLSWLTWDPEAAVVYVCCRGLGRSRCDGIPDVVPRHVLCGIGSRETYVHRGCAADVWAAAGAMLELRPDARGRLAYAGSSFGGGIGALALPWDDRFACGVLDVPSFGHHPIRLDCACVGSGAAVWRYYRSHPQVVDVLKYFDAAVAARFVRVPTLVSAALFDPSVPPPGQFAVYNAIPANKEIFVRQWAHFDPPGGAEEVQRVIAAGRAWIDRHTEPRGNEGVCH